MITTKGVKIKVKDITNICYGICIFLFVIGQSYLLSSSAILATLCQGLDCCGNCSGIGTFTPLKVQHS